MAQIFLKKLKESFLSVLPIMIVVSLLSFIIDIPKYNMVTFFICSAMLILGILFFNIGADMSLIIVGEKLGKSLSKKGKVTLIIAIFFVIGTILTIAEPSLSVFATQITSIPNWFLIIGVSLGVGIFFIVSIVSLLLKADLSKVIVISYSLIFILCLFVPPSFIAIAFDASGVTTGSITVPFVVSMTLGFNSLRRDKKAKEDGFGTLALGSIGPILIVLIMGFFLNIKGSAPNYDLNSLNNMIDVSQSLTTNLIVSFKDTLFSLAPIAVLIFLYQLITKKLNKKNIKKVIFGILFVYLGLSLFLTGACAGFLPIGYMAGTKLIVSDYQFIIFPIIFVLGYVLTMTEPAVQVLNDQIETATEGKISAKKMMQALCIGVGLAVLLSLIRTYFNFSFLYLLIPGYFIALALTFITPKLFNNIAFDAGGVVNGTMIASFILPFTIGVAKALGNDILSSAFGVIAFSALIPIITVQVMGLIYSYQNKVVVKRHIELNETIIEYGGVSI